MCRMCVCVCVCVCRICVCVGCECVCVCVCVCRGGVNVFVWMYPTDYSTLLLHALSVVLLDDRSDAS